MVLEITSPPSKDCGEGLGIVSPSSEFCGQALSTACTSGTASSSRLQEIKLRVRLTPPALALPALHLGTGLLRSLG